MKKKICVVTATRAEYGLLKPLIQRLAADGSFAVKVVATGMHLSPEFGLTYKEIEKDGVTIDKKIEILLSSDTPASISKTMGMAMMGFGDYFGENPPDAVVLLGDRYETLAVACAAKNARIPIVHLHGGEATEGAMDEDIRHAITKLSYLHMTSTKEYRQRVVQMGEDPQRVFSVGALGVENILHTPLLSREELDKQLGLHLKKEFALVTFHPVTLENASAAAQTEELLKVFCRFPHWDFIVTKANADEGGRIINRMLDDFASEHENVHVFDSLGLLRYLSAMKYCRMVMGNSSSGIIEAPSFRVPTINMGDRQKGRIRAASVIDCLPKEDSVLEAMALADSPDFREKLVGMENPYGDGDTSSKIVEILKKVFLHGDVSLKQKFYDIDFTLDKE